MSASERQLLDKCLALPVGSLLSLYTDFVETDPEWAVIPASALRVKARQGEFPEELVPFLLMCLIASPTEGAFLHLAKALAAFGRAAQSAAEVVAKRADALLITDDTMFWVFDSLLHVLSYLGGADAGALVARLQQESPLRVNARDGVYQGKISADERATMHSATLTQVAEMIALEDAGTWRKKCTTLTYESMVQESQPMTPWMRRK